MFSWIILSCFILSTNALLTCQDTTDNALSTPILLSPTKNYALQWKTAQEELYITLSIESPSDVTWLGFGFPEQTSGGMPGSDVVTIKFPDTGSAQAEDRFVEWRAFPFYPVDSNYRFNGTDISTSPTFFPRRDCENNGTNDWMVLASTKTSTCLRVSMKRKFVTLDINNDRDIPVGYSKFIWSFGTGSSFSYHNTNRGTDGATFIPNPSSSYGITPSPTISNVTLLFNNYVIPRNDTAYSCKMFYLNESIADLQGGATYDIIGFEPVIHAATKKYVHHIAFFGCPGNEAVPEERYKTARLCSDDGQPRGCFNMIFTWGVGAGALYMPPDVGIRVKAKDGFPNSTFAVWMQMHYTNLEHLPNLVDQSGVRLILDKSPKKYQSGTLLLGVTELAWVPLPPGNSMIHRQVTCPSGCTKYFKEPVHVFGSLLHMHEFGRKIWTSKFDYNGNFLGVMNRIDYWSFGNQQITPVNYTINPGDRLQTHCVYDSSKWRQAIPFREDTFSEMCFDVLSYYPVQFNPDPERQTLPFFNCGGYLAPDDSTRTVCTNRQLTPAFIATYGPSFSSPLVKFEQISDGLNVQGSSTSIDLETINSGSCSSGNADSGVSSTPGFDFEISNIAGMRMLWRKTGAQVKIRFESSTLWIAFGLTAPTNNGGNKMVGSKAIIGMPSTDPFLQTAGSQSCDVYALNAMSVSGIVKIANTGIISCVYTRANGLSTLEFVATSIGGFTFEGTTTSNGRLLAGSNAKAGCIVANGNGQSFGQHSAQANFQVDFATAGATLADSSARKLAHAVLMYISFILCVGIGALMAVYRDKFQKNWFLVHRLVMMFAVVIASAGLGVVVPVVASPMSKPHHFVGIIALFLMYVQPILGAIRPHLPKEPGELKTRKRVIWEFAHKNNGRMVFFLGIVNVALGAFVHGADLSPPLPNTGSAIPLFVTLMGLTSLVIIGFWLKKKLCSRATTTTKNEKDVEKDQGAQVVAKSD